MNTAQTGTSEPTAQKRWNGPSSTWFLLMIGSWIAFSIGAIWYPDTLTDFWEWGQRLPLAAEIGLWIGTLPWMLALAVFETEWIGWVQVTVIAAVAVAWIVFSRPQAPESPSPTPRKGTRQTMFRPEAR